MKAQSRLEVLQFHQHCGIIDPPHAKVQWRGNAARRTARATSEILELIEAGRAESLR